MTRKLEFEAFKKLLAKVKIREKNIIDLENYKIMRNLKSKQRAQTHGVGDSRSRKKRTILPAHGI